MRRHAVVLSCCLVLASLAGVADAAPGSINRVPTGQATTAADYCAGEEALAFLTIINDYRAEQDIGPLVLSPTLGAAAEHHSLDMATKDYFSHTLTDGTTWAENIVDHGYPGDASAGENIAGGRETAAEAFAQWRNSPSHDENMLRGAYTAIGIGRAYGEDAYLGWYWTTTFGSVVDGQAANCDGSSPSPPDGLAATVTSDLNLRKAPNLDAEILTVMPDGSDVVVTGDDQDGFSAIAFNGLSGWASREFLQLADASPAPDDDPGGNATAVTTSDVNLRAGPSTADDVLRVIPPGTTVTLRGTTENGFLAVTYDSVDGWAHGDYLTTDGAPADEPDPTGWGDATTTSDLNLRAGPSTSDDVLTVIPSGETVALTGDSVNGFLAVRFADFEGWAHGAYLALPTPPSPTAGTEAVVNTDLNLRAGPSLADDVLQVIPPGASVTLTGESSNGFFSINYNGTEGWAFAAYLE